MGEEWIIRNRFIEGSEPENRAIYSWKDGHCYRGEVLSNWELGGSIDSSLKLAALVEEFQCLST